MDVSRELLNNLMGRDRNMPKGNNDARDHYSNRDVCKPYLVSFCFNTLFPNTVFDEGPCTKRHDTYLKTMFDNDLGRQDHEKQYIKECINWIEKRLLDVEQKIKKNQAVIDNKNIFTGDRPKMVLDRLIAIDQDIENLMKQAEIYGQNGQIDESARCLEEVQRLRQHRRQVDSMNDTNNAIQKQQKICEICGAIQTINDTEKRIQTHLEGKIHQGFLKLRHQVETLRVRLQILNQMDPGPKKEEPQISGAIEKLPEKQIKQSRSRSHSKKKKKQKRERSKQRHKDRDRHKDHYRDYKKDDKYNDFERNRSRQKKERKKHKKDRDRSRSREKYSYY